MSESINIKDIKDINIGLLNIGNTCYINSLTQCLIHTDLFLELFMKEETKKIIIKNILKKNDKLIENNIINITDLSIEILKKTSYQLLILIKNIITNNKLNIKDYVQSICYNNKNFILGSQHDIQELFVFLINNFKTELNESVEVNFNKNIEKIYNGYNNLNDLLKEKINNLINNINKDFSIVTIPFIIIFKSIINCDCNYTNYLFDSNINLQLDIIGDNLYDCLDNYFNKEKCDFSCSNCNNLLVSKQEFIWLPPQILVIHLKRFKTTFIDDKYSATKIYDTINYPFELNMSKYIYNNNTDINYELYAVCNHFGSLDFGHYYAIINKNNTWYIYNDNKVSLYNFNDEKYKINDSYMLFYKLKNN